MKCGIQRREGPFAYSHGGGAFVSVLHDMPPEQHRHYDGRDEADDVDSPQHIVGGAVLGPAGPELRSEKHTSGIGHTTHVDDDSNVVDYGCGLGVKDDHDEHGNER